MTLRFFSFLLIGVLIGQAFFVPAPCCAASPEQQRQTLKEKLFEIDPGTIIQVKTRDKEQIRGRFEAMTDDGFTMKVAKGDQLSERTVSFGDVKSLKKESPHQRTRTAGWIVVGGLAALGTMLVALMIAVAASGGWD